MSQVIALAALPNQSISVQLDNVRYEMRFSALNNIMAVDINIDEELILQGQRVVAGSPVIPYRYLESGGGNFFFLTEFGDIPYWELFETSQTLLYVTAEELAAARGN